MSGGIPPHLEQVRDRSEQELVAVILRCLGIGALVCRADMGICSQHREEQGDPDKCAMGGVGSYVNGVQDMPIHINTNNQQEFSSAIASSSRTSLV